MGILYYDFIHIMMKICEFCNWEIEDEEKEEMESD